MLEDFLSYIESNLSVFREDKILLSISGGIDSMVMLHLFRQLGYNIEVAHINHSTRNGESNDDMVFIKTFCIENFIPFHCKTLNYNSLKEGNFQENARNERFQYLSEIKESEGCKWIATAHHKDDRWETFLMHLNRKSGLQGLTSLRSKQNQVIHPLLNFNKQQILTFGKQHSIEYVHDRSNDTNDYKRNEIRHKITPQITRTFPDFIENINQSIIHLDHSFSLLKELINQNNIVIKDQQTGYTNIDLEKVKRFENQKTLLFHILEQFGFNFSTACDILKTTSTGTKFYSLEHEGLYNRGVFIIRARKGRTRSKLIVESPGTCMLQDGRKLHISIERHDNIDNHLWINVEKIEWPLIVRNISPGDKFKPHGMKGASKTIKKLCTDLKIDAFTKEDLLIIEDKQSIIQIIGIRTSHGYVASDIKNALTFSIID